MFHDKIVLCLIVAILLATGCNTLQVVSPPSATPGAAHTSPTYTPTQSPYPKITATITITPTASPTLAPVLPTSTHTSTATLVPPTPTQTSTPAPTLTVAQSQAYLFELLKDNAGCKLPCWWGISPGVTTWEETRRLVLYMGYGTSDYPHEDRYTYHGTGGFDWPSPSTPIDIGFYEEKGIVEGIVVSAAANEDTNFFHTLWKSYSPEQVIAAYGPPTRILVGVFWYGETGFIASRIVLIYDEHKFLAAYESKALAVDGEDGKPAFRICPSWGDITWIPKLDMYILSPNNPMSLDEYVNLIAGPNLLEGGKSIEDAAGISIEEFSQRFQPGHGPACFDTPQEMWK